MVNPVTWFEVNGPEPEGTASFYAGLFGWSMSPIPDQNYILIDTHAGSGCNGGIGRTREGQPPHVVFYVENPDIDALLGRAGDMEASVVVPVTVIPDMATFAQFTDPFGNLVGLVQGDGSTSVSPGDNPPVDWFELSCTEPKKAWDFYGELFGWQITGGEGEGFVHGGVETGGSVRGGIGSSPDGQPHVAMYASVNDLAAYLTRAESLGGAAILQPMQVDDHTHIAALADPQGTMFGIYSSR